MRRALTRGTSSASLMAQTKAVERMIELQIPSPGPSLEPLCEELRFIGMDMRGTYQPGQAASKALRLLAWIEGEEEADPSEWSAIYFDESLSVEDRLIWLALHLANDMSYALNWRVDWMGDSPRNGWLVTEAAKVLNAEDPLAAAAEWLKEPPKPPARLRS